MARGPYYEVVEDPVTGRPAAGVRCYPYQLGTTNLLTGLHDALTGGSTIVTYITSNDQGEVEFFADTPQVFTMRYENPGTAHQAGKPNQKLAAFDFSKTRTVYHNPSDVGASSADAQWQTVVAPPTVWMDAVNGKDSGDPGYSAAVAGREDRAFKTIQNMKTTLIAAGIRDGAHVRFRGGPRDTAPAQTFLVTEPWVLEREQRVTGGGADSKDQKARTLIKNGGGFPVGGALMVGSRNSVVEYLGFTNSVVDGRCFQLVDGAVGGSRGSNFIGEELHAYLSAVGFWVESLNVDQAIFRSCNSEMNDTNWIIGYHDTATLLDAPNLLTLDGCCSTQPNVLGVLVRSWANDNPNRIHFRNFKNHSTKTKMRIEGGRNIHVEGGYWEGLRMDTDQTYVVIRNAGSGTGEGLRAHGIRFEHVRFNGFNPDTGIVHTGLVPLLFDVDYCNGFSLDHPHIEGDGVGWERWAPNRPYTLNERIIPTVPNGHVYKVTVAGTSAGTEPVWPTAAGGSIVNGTATFTEMNASNNPLVRFRANTKRCYADFRASQGALTVVQSPPTIWDDPVLLALDDNNWVANGMAWDREF